MTVTCSSKSNITQWTLLTGVVFVLFAIIVIAYCTSTIGIDDNRQQLSPTLSLSNNVALFTSIQIANQRWRAEFDADVLHHNSAMLKGTMMFWSCNDNTRNNRLMLNHLNSAIWIELCWHSINWCIIWLFLNDYTL